MTLSAMRLKADEGEHRLVETAQCHEGVVSIMICQPITSELAFGDDQEV